MTDGLIKQLEEGLLIERYRGPIAMDLGVKANFPGLGASLHWKVSLWLDAAAWVLVG